LRSFAVPNRPENSAARFAAVVLAAGASRRMGTAKALLPLGGEPIIRRVVRTCADASIFEQIIVVTGHGAEHVVAAVEPYDLTLTHNANFDAGGMISSIQAGLRAVWRGIDSAFIVLGDQPLISAETHRALSRVFDGRILRPLFAGKHGHPILIPSEHFSAILALDESRTLKQFVQDRVTVCVDLPVDDPAILMDVDTPADYERAITMFERSSRCEEAELSSVTAE
jgi:molybdenum cofactor cytidylyltransferase